MTSKVKISLYIFLSYLFLLLGQNVIAQTDTSQNSKVLIGKNKDHVEIERHEFHEQIESRVLFGGGRNEPNQLGKEHLNFIIQGLKKDIDKYEHLYPEDKIILKIEIKGYSDSKPFYPTQTDGERKAYNKYLSKKRAYYINNEIKKGLFKLIHGVEQDIVAKGEELPPYYPEDEGEDPQRRMCIVTVLAYSMPNDSFNLRKNDKIVAIDHSESFKPDLVESKRAFLAVNMPNTSKKYRPGGKLTASNPRTNPNFKNTNTTTTKTNNNVVKKSNNFTITKNNKGDITPIPNGRVVYTKSNAVVKFHTGWHTPKPQDYSYLQQLIKDIKEKVAAYRRENGDKPMVIQLDVTGYADKQGYYYGQPEAQRKQQNKRLSLYRARNVGLYLQRYLKSQNIKVTLKTEGRGEELPPGVSDGPIDDASRRTCLASIQVVEGQVLNSR